MRYVLALLRAKYPVRSRRPGWLGPRVDAAVRARYQAIRGERYAAIAAELEKAGLSAEAIALKETTEFFAKEAGWRGQTLLETQRPARGFATRYRRIWRAKNWIIRSRTNREGRVFYYADQFTPMPDVYTDRAGWRLINFWQRTTGAFKNGLYWLVYRNWWNGPLGVKLFENRLWRFPERAVFFLGFSKFQGDNSVNHG